MNNHCEIALTQGKVALVDHQDYDDLIQHKWYAHLSRGSWYARRNGRTEDGKQYTIFMHRQILGLSREDIREGDHISAADTLDNRRCNLRIASHRQNCHNRRLPKNNTTGFKGVTLIKRLKANPYQAYLRSDGEDGTRKVIYLGLYPTAEEAAEVVDAAARARRGEFASPNFPERGIA